MIFVKETKGLNDLEKKNLYVSNIHKSDSLISNDNKYSFISNENKYSFIF